jgi:phage repressor protein C with HTH and peptisase S24 domain
MNRNFQIYKMQTKQIFSQEIIERMKTVLGFTKDDELANYLGKGKSTVAGWRARSSIPITEAIQIAQQHNVSLDWLILNRGPIAAPVAVDPGAVEPGAVGGVIMSDTDEVPGYVDLVVLDMATFHSTSNDRAWKVPRMWLAQEGLTVEDTVLVRAAGDTMIPTIQDGQMVMVDRRPRDSDGVYLLRYLDSNTVRFKRVQRMFDGSLRLSNDNPAYTVDVVASEDAERIEFIGYCHASVQQVR